ncbi:2-oxoacid:ferredoxin oxidoreductase subunit beta [Candidatus Woesearchaeota archaeon]|nr:MAG: 2-oxoacid:ferredoxin oxidoreductase subunit beta [Candidatus Woesearchaeota archaeon]
MAITREDLQSPLKPTWCPGCGDYGIWLSVKQALIQSGYKHEEVCLVYGIGCHGHMCNTLRAYGFEGLHGRPIPVAEGIKLANNRLKVIVVAGDGDTFGEGLNHFIAGIRGNHDITLIVHDNRVYGLTTGQASPTSAKGYKSKSTPQGVIEVPVNPIALAIAAGGSFVARGFAADPKQLTELILRGLEHKGFAVIDVMQNCISFNHVNTVLWFKEHSYHLEDEGHDPSNKIEALKRALDEERLGTGIFYQDSRGAYDAQLAAERVPLVDHDLSSIDISESMEQFT